MTAAQYAARTSQPSASEPANTSQSGQNRLTMLKNKPLLIGDDFMQLTSQLAHEHFLLRKRKQAGKRDPACAQCRFHLFGLPVDDKRAQTAFPQNAQNEEGAGEIREPDSRCRPKRCRKLVEVGGGRGERGDGGRSRIGGQGRIGAGDGAGRWRRAAGSRPSTGSSKSSTSGRWESASQNASCLRVPLLRERTAKPESRSNKGASWENC